MKKQMATFLLICSIGHLSAKQYVVSNAAEINARTFVSGDTIVMKNKQWEGDVITIKGEGVAGCPIILRAETAGEVRMQSPSRVIIKGSYIEVSGLNFPKHVFTGGKNPIIEFASGSTYCRLTNTSIDGYNLQDKNIDTKWVSIKGQNHRIDHCYFANKTNMGTTMVVWLVRGEIAGHRIDHNYFGPRVSLRDLAGKELNGQETIRVGDSSTSLTFANCLVEDNYFEKCNGEIEVISNKSCGNIYRNNVFKECAGTLCLRHGHDCRVEGNVFFADGEAKAGGVRVMGENHVVQHNYFYRVQGESYRAALSLTKGNENTILNRYSQVKNALIDSNVFVDCVCALDVAVGADTDQPEPPLSSKISNNRIYNSLSAKNEILCQRDHRSQVVYENNLYNKGQLKNTGALINKGFIKDSDYKEENQSGNGMPSPKTTGVDWEKRSEDRSFATVSVCFRCIISCCRGCVFVRQSIR